MQELRLCQVAQILQCLDQRTEVVTVAFAKEQGAPGLTGALLAIWASGSLISGIVTGLVAMRATPRPRPAASRSA